MAVSLALDAFAVSTSTAIATPGFRKRDALKMGIWFGCFQAAMPLAGWLLATSLSQYIVAFDHFIAFGLLAFIGGRMVWGSFEKNCEQCNESQADACDLSRGGEVSHRDYDGSKGRYPHIHRRYSEGKGHRKISQRNGESVTEALFVGKCFILF